MVFRLSSPASLFLGTCVIGGMLALQARADDLIPAAYGIWTDRAGSSWSVEPDGNIGRIGSSMVNSGLALMVNEEKFTAHQPMMTPDAKEFVLQGVPLDSLPGLRVQRRIRLLEEPGGIRYAELFHNGSASRLSVTVGLATNFSGNFKTFFSDRGRSEPLLLTGSETGVIVLPGTSQSSRAFLFTLTGGAAAATPTVSSQNRYGLHFRYRLDLEPGESRVIVHHVAQVVIPQSFDRRTLLDLSEPYALEAIREKAFAADWAGHVINVPKIQSLPPGEESRSRGLAALGVESGVNDVLALGQGNRLGGKAEGGPLALESPFGSANFDLPELAAVVGEQGGRGGSSTLYLRDGQIFNGRVAAPGLRFIPSSGAAIDLDPVRLDRLLLAGATPLEKWPEGTAAMVETREGDRIRVADENVVIELATPWGVLPFALRDLVWMVPVEGGAKGMLVVLKNGTRLSGYLATGEIAFGGSDLGDLLLPVPRLRSIITEIGWSRADATGPATTAPYLRLGGEDLVAATVSETTLPVSVEGTVIDLNFSDLRRIEREGNGEMIRCQRWDGGTLSGVPRAEQLTVSVAGRTWTIPVSEIREMELAPPALDDAKKQQVQQLISNLGSSDWATRESATRELITFGYLLRPVLQRELAQTADPEVGRRLERVLSNLN